MNISNPALTHTKKARLSNGEEIEIIGQTFERPIFEGGEMPIHTFVRLMREDEQVGIAFFQYPMPKGELEDKVDNVSESPDDYLAPEYKAKINN